jgi:uncharacterized caspase-like protein
MQYGQKLLSSLLILLAAGFLAPATAQQSEKRIALVIGNGAYAAAPLQTAANDAGLIAQTLEAAGFDVVGARDLDQDSLRRAFRDFLDKASASGPDTVAFIYLSGYSVQLEGENYFVPVDAKIDRASDVPAEAARISDYIRPLADLKLKATIVVLDGARPNQFAQSGSPLAGGLALVEPEPGTLIAFNAAPGTVAPEGQGPYGAYAQALAEMLRDGGLSLNELFDRVRLRVNEMTNGAEVPWNESKIQAPFEFFVRAADAPPPEVSTEHMAELQSRPLRDLGARDAYIAALDRDTLRGYLDFLAAYPDDPMAKRVRAIVAARREAITWRRTRLVDTPRAYWSYLRRYSRGPHAYDARRRLEYLSAALEPPPSFEMIEYDVPPPPRDEIIYIDRPVLYFDDPDFDFAPPPPPPVIFLPARPRYIVELPAPPPPIVAFVLPFPVYRPVPTWVRPPAHVAPPPPNNIIFRNIYNTVVINNRTYAATITSPGGQTRKISPAVQSAPAARGQGGRNLVPTAAVVGPALPPSITRKATRIQSHVLSQPGVLPSGNGQSKIQQGAKQGAPALPTASTAFAPEPGKKGHQLPHLNHAVTNEHRLPAQLPPMSPPQVRKQTSLQPPSKPARRLAPTSQVERAMKRPSHPEVKAKEPTAVHTKQPATPTAGRLPSSNRTVNKSPSQAVKRHKLAEPSAKRHPPQALAVVRPSRAPTAKQTPTAAGRKQATASKPGRCPPGARLVGGRCVK